MDKKVRSDSTSPIGDDAAEDFRARERANLELRRLREETQPFQEIAWKLVRYRMDRGLTQLELAKRVGTSHTQISRIESGRHATSVRTLQRIAEALDLDIELVPRVSGEQGDERGVRRRTIAAAS